MILMRSTAVLAAVGLLVPGLTACGGDAGAPDDGPSVVASFYPLQYVAQRVAGDLGFVSLPGRHRGRC